MEEAWLLAGFLIGFLAVTVTRRKPWRASAAGEPHAAPTEEVQWDCGVRWKCSCCQYKNPGALSRCLVCLNPRVAQWHQGKAVAGPSTCKDTFMAPSSLLPQQRDIVEEAGLTVTDCRTQQDHFRRACAGWVSIHNMKLDSVHQDTPMGVLTMLAQFLFPRGGVKCDTKPPHFYRGFYRERDLVEDLAAIKSKISFKLGQRGEADKKKVERDLRRFSQKNPDNVPALEVLSHLMESLVPLWMIQKQLEGLLGDQNRLSNPPLDLFEFIRHTHERHDRIPLAQVYSTVHGLVDEYSRVLKTCREVCAFNATVHRELRILKPVSSKSAEQRVVQDLLREMAGTERLIAVNKARAANDGTSDHALELETWKKLRARRCIWKQISQKRKELVASWERTWDPDALSARLEEYPVLFELAGLTETCGNLTPIRQGTLKTGACMEDFTKLAKQPLHPDDNRDESSVAFVKDYDEKMWAIRSFVCQPEGRPRLWSHVSLLNDFGHPNLLPVHGVFFEQEHANVMSPFIPSGFTLEDYLAGETTLPALTKRQAQSILRDVLLGLQVLHSRQHVHSHVSPNTILLRSSGVVEQAVLDSWWVDGWPGTKQTFSCADDMLAFGRVAQTLWARTAPNDHDSNMVWVIEHLLCSDPLLRLSADEALQCPAMAAPDAGPAETIQGQLHTCPICHEQVPGRRGISCEDGHFLCDDDLARYLDSLNPLQISEGRSAPCFEASCNSELNAHDIARHLSREAYESFLDKLKQANELETTRKLQSEFERRRNELMEQMENNVDEGVAKMHAADIVDNILTLKCPNGHAFCDFTGCFALECAVCHVKFCGYCLVDCGADAHPHVRSCRYNMVGGNLFAPIEYFYLAQRERRIQALDKYATEKLAKETLRNRVGTLLEPFLRELGLAEYKFPSAVRNNNDGSFTD